MIDYEYRHLEDKFCKKCGKKLYFQFFESGTIDEKTGQKMMYAKYVCDEKKTLWDTHTDMILKNDDEKIYYLKDDIKRLFNMKKLKVRE